MLIPSALQSLHAFSEHEHAVACTSKKEHHFHIKTEKCFELHKKQTVFNVVFFNEVVTLTKHFFLLKTTYKSLLIKKIYHSTKLYRGPPNFTF